MIEKVKLFICQSLFESKRINCRWRGLAMLILLLIAGFEVQAGQSQAISLGIHTTIPPFMWKDGRSLVDSPTLTDAERKRWTFLQANLDQTVASGGQWNIVTVRQWMDGESTFPRLQRIIEEHEKRGLKVVFRVIEDPAVFEHLSNTELADSGFNREYFLWVQALAKAFGSKVQYFLIGNEAELDQGPHYRTWKPNAPAHVQPTYDEYAKVLKTAVKAIKSVDSGLQVANAGFSDKSLALAVAQEIFDKQGIGDAQRFWEDWKSIGGTKAEGRLGLYRLLKGDDVQRRIDFVRRAAREPVGSDLFQLHYYGGWRALQPMLDWVNREMRVGKAERPIIAAEVGYMISASRSKGEDGRMRWNPDLKYYSENEHAENAMKNFAILAAHGVKMALYWHMRESGKSDLAVRLFPATNDPAEFKANRASRAFRVLGEVLNGAHAGQPRLPLRPGLQELRIIGASDVSLIWSDGGNVSPFLQGVSQVRDIEGNPVNMADRAKPQASPVYLFWSSGAPTQPASKDNATRKIK